MAEVPPDSGATQDLLQRAHAGDSQALEERFAGYRPYLCQFVALRLDPKLRPRLDPSDVVQEAQMEAARRLTSYLEGPPLPFRLWLRQIAQDRLNNLHRRHLATARQAVGREQPLPEQSSALLAELPKTMIPAGKRFGRLVEVTGSQRLQGHEPSPVARFNGRSVAVFRLVLHGFQR
jgi:RNA polymerase sigma-70 factor (ECF subfamily)